MAKEEVEGLKLKIELIPETSWGNNLRKHIKRGDWDRISREVCANQGNNCGICGVEGRLEYHEIWDYDDKQHVQRLVGFIARCDMCHHVKHIGRAGILAKEGKLDFGKVIVHFIKVNGCDKAAFENHSKEVAERWKERSKHQWQIELGKYQNMVESDSP